jgi:hypothetical protein
MTSYWLSFRLHDEDGWENSYDQRRKDLIGEIEACCGNGSNWWYSTTSFFIFESSEDISSIVTRVKRAIDQKVDLVVIGMNDYKGGRVVGRCLDNDIFALVPDIKNA